MSKKIFNYLIGVPISELRDNKLPTYRDVINLFIYKHTILNLTIRQSSTNTICELNNVWYKFSIPTSRCQYNIKKLESFYQLYQNLKKNSRGKKTPIHIEKIKGFKTKLDKLFDISQSSEVENLPSDIKSFLLKSRERGGYRCSTLVTNEISNVNQEPPEQHEENTEDDNENDCNTKNLSRKLSQFSLSSQSKQSSDISDNKRVHSDFEDELPKAKIRKISFITPELVAALDRTQITDRQAMFIICATLDSLGLDVDDYCVSHSTIHNHRKKFRNIIAESIKEKSNFPKCLTLHWDGKLLSTNSSTSKVEKLPILVTGINTEMLLDAPILYESTGVEHAEMIHEVLLQWNVQDKIKALCSDTPSVNTGCMNGTCTLLTEKLGREVLYFACRHHTHEIMLRKVVETAWPATNSPNVPIFKRFQTAWEQIDKSKFKIGVEDENIKITLLEIKDEKVIFLDDQLKLNHSRDDYKELLMLCKIFLGAVPRSEVKFRAPGAMHHARWLSKALYSFKMYMFRSEFQMRPSEISSLREICCFLTFFYIEAWFEAPCAIKASNNDLELFKSLLKYQKVQPKIAAAALEKLSLHLWYLHEELVCLALFDSNVTREQKLKIVNSTKANKSFNIKGKRPQITQKLFDTLETKEICDFASKKSIFLFEAFELPYEFIYNDPDSWESDEDYNECLKTFSSLKVVNDVAERGVALAEKYNDCLTRDEEERKNILQVVYNHRKNYPNCSKSELKIR
ncbi:uncharacterized protein LOC130669614 [Microplitis mediator]|uniref:uncharacterized protein LOC130669614 n=1 Tax=Microplitis mediator TaxID=375433 RepID=UPI0025553E95|nr:uncharacterized protein LOC130669614 [Microplitis mediator]